MKLHINKIITVGKFYVNISVTDFSVEEKQRMDKFGVPSINIKPLYVYSNNKYMESIPLNQFDHRFPFNTEFAANGFAGVMKARIEEAVAILKSREDKFSETEQYEI